MAEKRTSGQIAEAVTKTDIGGSFLNSLLAGLLVGWLLDTWLGTDPWLVIVFALLGAYSGFMRTWAYAKEQGARDEEERIARGR